VSPRRTFTSTSAHCFVADGTTSSRVGAGRLIKARVVAISPARPRPFARMGTHCPAEQIQAGAIELLDYSLIRDGTIKSSTLFRAATGTRSWRRLIPGRTVLVSDMPVNMETMGATKLRFRRYSAIEPRGVGGFAPLDVRRRPRSDRPRCFCRLDPPAKLRTPAAFATTLISQEDSGIDLVMQRVPTLKEAVPLTTG
jgi:hypothetical protein